jgi:hypothetical protein
MHGIVDEKDLDLLALVNGNGGKLHGPGGSTGLVKAFGDDEQ